MIRLEILEGRAEAIENLVEILCRHEQCRRRNQAQHQYVRQFEQVTCDPSEVRDNCQNQQSTSDACEKIKGKVMVDLCRTNGFFSHFHVVDSPIQTE